MSDGDQWRESVERLNDAAKIFDERDRLKGEVERLRNIPVDALLDCPKCGESHIDKPQPEKNWTNPPHRTHECQKCGHLWRPYDVATNGVTNPLKTERDELKREVERLKATIDKMAANLAMLISEQADELQQKRVAIDNLACELIAYRKMDKLKETELLELTRELEIVKLKLAALTIEKARLEAILECVQQQDSVIYDDAVKMAGQ